MSLHLRQAIETKYLGPTNSRGPRIKATAQAGSRTADYLHNLNIEENHSHAARQLAEKLGWKGNWYGGGTPKGDYVFVCSEGAAFKVEG
jgi:hypothetical protein